MKALFTSQKPISAPLGQEQNRLTARLLCGYTLLFAIFYAMQGEDKDFIRKNVLEEYYPEWKDKTYAEIKPGYYFDETCQMTIPAALICFLESKNYVDCITLAISLGGDADTLAAIAGPMAYAYYKYMPQELIDNAKAKLPQWMLELNDELEI